MDAADFSRLVGGQLNQWSATQTLASVCDILQCTTSERIELFRLARKIPPELITAFCNSAEDAKTIYSSVLEVEE